MYPPTEEIVRAREKLILFNKKRFIWFRFAQYMYLGNSIIECYVKISHWNCAL